MLRSLKLSKVICIVYAYLPYYIKFQKVCFGEYGETWNTAIATKTDCIETELTLIEIY